MIYSIKLFFRFRIELVVDNRVNRSTLSANGIRNAVSLQPVLYVGGIPNNNQINLTGSGLNPHGFQGCLASFVVDGRLLDYQRALVLNGQVKMNVCSGKFHHRSPYFSRCIIRKHIEHFLFPMEIDSVTKYV